MRFLRAGLVPVALLVMAASSLTADWKITTRETYNGRASTEATDYCREGMTRTERDLGARSSMTIITKPNGQWIAIDGDSREYTDSATYRNQPVLNAARTLPSHVNYAIDTATRATGEKRLFFGIEAQRYVTTQRRRTIVEGVSPDQETAVTIDGWYAHIDGCAPRFGRSAAASVSYLGSGSGGPPKLTFTHSGPTLPNLPLSESTGNFVMEVTQLSNAPLDPKLFGPPAGFRLVDRLNLQPGLSWLDHVLFAWDQFEGWLGNLL